MVASAASGSLLKRHSRDALWVAGGSVVTAVGTLVGVRVLTQFLAPAEYGAVSLALGSSTLALGLIATPLTQAAMHYYPAARTEGTEGELERSVLRLYGRLAPWLLLLLACAVLVCARWQIAAPVAIAAAGVLLCIDSLRSAGLSLLNSARQHRRYVVWMASDTWGRPLIATVAVLLFGASSGIVLCAYVAVAGTLVMVFSGPRWMRLRSASQPVYSEAQRHTLDARMWAYALPLVPLGIINWASNLGDRYIIGATLGLAYTGAYAAMYGISGMSFMVVNGAVENALRPVHQAAVTAGDHARAARIQRLWLAAIVGICSMGVIALALGHHLVASLFLGPAYRDWSILMPWIGLGYAIRATSYVFERVCYAYGQSRRVLAIQLCAAASTVIATPAGVLKWGLMGAAVAVSVNFSVQLAAAIFFARRTLREAVRARPELADDRNESVIRAA
jgi:O-antigen/teichoic acid export membrane protein